MVSTAVGVHPTSLQLWLLRLGVVGAETTLHHSNKAGRKGGGSEKVGSSHAEGSDSGLKELERLSKEALKLIPEQVWSVFKCRFRPTTCV